MDLLRKVSAFMNYCYAWFVFVYITIGKQDVASQKIHRNGEIPQQCMEGESAVGRN